MLRIRIATAAVLLAILLPTIFAAPPWVWSVVSLVFVALAMAEWTALLGHRRWAFPSAVLVTALGAALIVWNGLPGLMPSLATGGAPAGAGVGAGVDAGREGVHGLLPPLWGHVSMAALTLFWLVGGPLRLATGNARAGSWPTALLLLMGAWIALVELRQIGVWALVSSMAIVWVADVAAYFAGKAFGRHKLAPTISPGKSREGALGGMICVGLYGLALAWFTPPQALTLPSLLAGRVGAPAMVAVLMVLTALSIVGDLHESLVKRQAGVKDSGRTLPGHGGVLDRIDALLPVMPAALLLYQWLR